MAVPYTFGSATTSIPLSQLDSNFATTITLGNTAIQLGNTVTTLNNMTLANATVSSGNVTVLNATVTNDASISGLTVGQGLTSGQNNTAFGNGVLAANTGSNNTAVGYLAGNKNTSGTVTAFGQTALYANTTGVSNSAFGQNCMPNNTTGGYNTAVGISSLAANTTASNNTAVGYQAGYSNVTGIQNAFFGYQAGYSSTGGNNTFIGQGAGYYVTSGAKNTIIGEYTGNSGGLDIRTSNNYIVLSDGDGNPRAFIDNTGALLVGTNGNTASNNRAQFDSSAASWTVVARNLASSGTNYAGYLTSFPNYSPNDASSQFFQGSDTSGVRFQVRSNGGIANYSANNSNLSDKREKKNVELSGNYLNKICAIPVKTFLYNDQTDTDKNLGVIAQDVQEVAPELVMESNWGTEEEPKMRLSIYQTDLQYALMKSIQELKTIVDAQAAEIAELKAKVA